MEVVSEWAETELDAVELAEIGRQFARKEPHSTARRPA